MIFRNWSANRGNIPRVKNRLSPASNSSSSTLLHPRKTRIHFRAFQSPSKMTAKTGRTNGFRSETVTVSIKIPRIIYHGFGFPVYSPLRWSWTFESTQSTREFFPKKGRKDLMSLLFTRGSHRPVATSFIGGRGLGFPFITWCFERGETRIQPHIPRTQGGIRRFIASFVVPSD